MTVVESLPVSIKTAEHPLILVPKTPGILRVVIYARISKLRRGNSENTAIQVAECLREAEYVAKERGLQLVVVAVFQEDDRGASKYSKKLRPQWDRAGELVRDSWVDMIMATESERLTRRPSETHVLIDLAEKTDLRELYLTRDECFDLSSPEGIYRARQAVNLAERESNKISQRSRKKQTTRAEQGYSHGGRRCFGFKPGNSELDEDVELPVLREMAKQRLKPKSFKEIGYWLNEQGHRTTEGKLWTAITVRNTLQRKRYAPHPADPKFGIREHKGAEYQAQWPAAFDQETWEQLRLLDKLGTDKYKNRSPARKYLLTGFLHCGKCGTRLNGETKRDKPDKPLRPVYHCRVQGDTQRKHGCGGVTRGAEPLDDFVLTCLFYRLDTPELGALLQPDEKNKAKLKDLLEDRTNQERRIQEILDDYAEGELTREQKNRAKAKADSKLEEINQEIDKLSRGHKASTLIPVGMSVREAWEATESLTWRRELIGLLIEKIVVHPGGGKPRYECTLSEKVFKFDPNQIDIHWIA
ncbi:recombinase family protein [Streptomyces lincolnensis]|uniref:recombinase family protein n=1 Tax=Streptomyces lincolnensis TaxID=1915 RepID=UPI0037CD0B8B